MTSSLTNLWSVILGVAVPTMPRTPSLPSLFFTWVCFSLSFSTVFQAFLKRFLTDSGYKTPIKNKDELLNNGNKLSYHQEDSFIFYGGDETEESNILRNRLNCPSIEICVDWAKYQKNVSILFSDSFAVSNYANGQFVGENSEPLICRLEDRVVFTSGRSMIMVYGDPLWNRVTEIIYRVVEVGLYNYWISKLMNADKIRSRRIAIFNPLDGYYSFNLYHMQPAFYLLLMGWCISVICFIVELMHNCVLSKTK
jgi:hypothetical protein